MDAVGRARAVGRGYTHRSKKKRCLRLIYPSPQEDVRKFVHLYNTSSSHYKYDQMSSWDFLAGDAQNHRGPGTGDQQ